MHYNFIKNVAFMRDFLELAENFFEDALDPVSMTHAETGVFYYANKAYCKMVGFTKKELEKMSVIDIDDGLTPENFAQIKELVIQNDPFVRETTLTTKSGAILPVEKSIKYINNNCFCGFYVLHKDILDKKIMRSTIRDNKKTMEMIALGSAAGLWNWDIKKDKAIYSNKYKQILGFPSKTPNSTIYKHWRKNIYQEDVSSIYKKFINSVKANAEFKVEYRIKDLQGNVKWISSSGVISRDKNGVPEKMGGSIIEITDLKEQLIANRELSQKLDIFRFFVESAPYGLMIIDEKDKIIFANSAAYYEFVQKSKLVGKNINIIFSGLRDISWLKIRSILSEKGSYKFEDVFQVDDKEIYMSLIAHNIEYDDQNCICISAVDNTATKVAQNMLRESEERFRLATKASRDGIWEERRDAGGKQYWSERYYEILGYEDGEIEATRENFLKSVHPDDITKVNSAYWNYLKNKNRYEVEVRLKTKSDEYKWFKSYAYCEWVDGKPVRMVGTLRDINSRKLREQQIIESNKKLEQMNQDLEDFAYIASHDLKQPLHGIHSYAAFLAEDNAGILNEESKMMLDRLQQQAAYMDELITRLLTYARTSRKSHFQLVDINKIVEDIILSIKQYIDEHNGEVAVEGDLHKIMCNKEIIGELFRNLIINGIKYNDSKKKKVVISSEVIGSKIYYHIKDNGIGIDLKYYKVVFGLFKRLHAREKYGGGTGFGLTLVKKIVDLHKGDIQIESKVGEGSDFIISLPIK